MKSYITQQFCEIADLFKDLVFVVKKKACLLILIIGLIALLNFCPPLNIYGLKLSFNQTIISLLDALLINFITVITIVESYLRVNSKKMYSSDIYQIFKDFYYYITKMIDTNPHSSSCFQSRGAHYRDGFIVYGETTPDKTLVSEVEALINELNKIKSKRTLKKDLIRYLPNENVSDLEEILNKLEKLPSDLNKLDIYTNVKSIMSSYEALYFWLEKSPFDRDWVEKDFWKYYIEILEEFKIIIKKLSMYVYN